MFPRNLKTKPPFQTFEQFENDGCDNCESFLRMKNNKDNVYDHTSNNFDGLIALMNPDDSWVCKWQRIDPRAAKGMYAISVSGKLPLSTVRDMKNRGIPYRSRDTSQR
ncbi:SUPT4H1 family protein [Megaselia abdita]